MAALRAEAAGRAERLVDGHGETPPPAAVVALGQRRDGHERDGVRDPGAWRVRQGDRRDDGLVVTVAAGDREGGGRNRTVEVRGRAEEMEDPREVSGLNITRAIVRGNVTCRKHCGINETIIPASVTNAVYITIKHSV